MSILPEDRSKAEFFESLCLGCLLVLTFYGRSRVISVQYFLRVWIFFSRLLITLGIFLRLFPQAMLLRLMFVVLARVLLSYRK